MSLLVLEGFTKYAAVSEALDIAASQAAGTIGNTDPRTPGVKYVRNGSLWYSLGGAQANGTRLIIGAVIRVVGTASGLAPIALWTTTGGSVNGRVWTMSIQSDTQLLGWQNDDVGSQYGTFPVPADEWCVVEVDMVLQTGATGSIKMYLNGVEIINQDNIITLENANPAYLRLISGSGNMDVECFYVAKDDGVGICDPIGNFAVHYAKVSADTAQKDFAPSGAGDNYEMVDDDTPDEDSTYVSSDVDGAADLYAHADGFTQSSVYAVRGFARVKKASAGTMGFKTKVKSGSTEHKGTLFVPSDTAYTTCHTGILEEDPDTEDAWTANALNDLLVGFENTTTP